MAQHDYQLALLLQRQFEHEASIDKPRNNLVYSQSKQTSHEKSLVDPSWELIDPTPNIYTLFVAFNVKYFWNKLQAVCVEWSKRMTSCAGICYYSGHGGLCRISLSEPLLKLRPRKDLIETLLHEMIHAYLFITANNKDRDGHGSEFHKHMYRINGEAGTNISVYHNFIDEVQLYQQHWWRCNGPCQHKKPYFGMVRRAVNRAPGPNDRWWDEHLRNCGGSFIKVKEPEKPNKKITKAQPSNTNNIVNYFPILRDKTNNSSTSYKSNNVVGFNDFKGKTCGSTCTNANGTIVVTKKPVQNIQAPIISKPVHAATIASTITRDATKDDENYARVRKHWINKYPNSSTEVHIKREKPIEEEFRNDVTCKRHKPNDTDKVKCPICEKEFMLDNINSHLDKCLQQMSEVSSSSYQTPTSSKNGGETHNQNDNDEVIPCLVCSKMVLKINLNCHLDECMGDDIFTNNEHLDNIENEVDIEKRYNCPVCSQQFYISEMSNHLNMCLVNDNTFDDPF